MKLKWSCFAEATEETPAPPSGDAEPPTLDQSDAHNEEENEDGVPASKQIKTVCAVTVECDQQILLSYKNFIPDYFTQCLPSLQVGPALRPL